MNFEFPPIALSIGDCNGIGPEIAVRTARKFSGRCRLLLYGPGEIIREACRRFTPGFVPEIRNAGEFSLSDLHPGELSAKAGKAAYDAVVAAAKDAIAGRASAIVTAPVNKAAVNLAGIPFTGHTELVAELCGTKHFAMMQSAGPLRVIFATTHIPIADVAKTLTGRRIQEVARLVEEAAMAEGIAKPAIAVAGLNPHAGENGNMGREDEEIVKPAIAELKASGMNVSGPYPSDTLFVEKIRTGFDGIVAMYHDQGHIPFKMLAFDRGVNSTMGLPIIRTSVDHGTAFEIAWKGIADTGSLEAAVSVALLRASRRPS